MPVVCLGEAIVDLVGETPARSVEQAAPFVPHSGGATANVAVSAARHGGRPLLAGGAGDDAWGRWLRDRLAAEGVGLDLFGLVPGLATPVAFTAIAEDGEPAYAVYGDGIAATLRTLAGRIEPAVRRAGALFFGSNTLVGAAERDLTLAARAAALTAGHPVIVDPNLRLHRWASLDAWAEIVREALRGAFLVKANREEAALLTGEEDPVRAADALVADGATLVVVTVGRDGALVRGAVQAEAPGEVVDVVSTMGAGDAFAGVLLARLEQAGWDPAAMSGALPDAVHAAARVCRGRGALG
jgi:sugar/nucleoside kinase (ribokinase family)